MTTFLSRDEQDEAYRSSPDLTQAQQAAVWEAVSALVGKLVSITGTPTTHPTNGSLYAMNALVEGLFAIHSPPAAMSMLFSIIERNAVQNGIKFVTEEEVAGILQSADGTLH